MRDLKADINQHLKLLKLLQDYLAPEYAVGSGACPSRGSGSTQPLGPPRRCCSR